MTREKWWAVRVVNEMHPERNGWLDETSIWHLTPCTVGSREDARRIAIARRLPGYHSEVKRITVEYD
jgi:hypothetical protein